MLTQRPSRGGRVEECPQDRHDAVLVDGPGDLVGGLPHNSGRMSHRDPVRRPAEQLEVVGTVPDGNRPAGRDKVPKADGFERRCLGQVRRGDVEPVVVGVCHRRPERAQGLDGGANVGCSEDDAWRGPRERFTRTEDTLSTIDVPVGEEAADRVSPADQLDPDLDRRDEGAGEVQDRGRVERAGGLHDVATALGRVEARDHGAVRADDPAVEEAEAASDGQGTDEGPAGGQDDEVPGRPDCRDGVDGGGWDRCPTLGRQGPIDVERQEVGPGIRGSRHAPHRTCDAPRQTPRLGVR
ncbi:hypothetical protein L1785_02645 [Antribacter sp. KLBMP9083]|uniref:Uncharacterized protein n=1 Tax=Antribacter soli TaxID=2910976 RepID=A0AA41QAH5_9MICO|nr:hypothetical protein [Antribacter soli]MCF4119868.1 hypothetical protein [Antribacter soli]